MSICEHKPPYIFAYAADQQGCGFQRILMPMSALLSAGLAEGMVQGNMMRLDQFKALNPDVIVWQRQLEESQIAHMREVRELLPGCHFVYELDDYLIGVPDESYHVGFMPPGIEDRIKTALTLCDSVSTTTQAMADWMEAMGGKDIRVIPNLVPVSKVRERDVSNSAKKLRVGFGGGISHAGDLKIIRHAMETIGEAVEWVFIGMQPDNPPCPVEFHHGVPPLSYLDKLFSLNMDLVLAPLQDNHFNVCKSNLRLVEAGACDAAVIAQNMSTYWLKSPPVVSFATTPEDWTHAIQRFMAMPSHERRKHAKAMRTWVGQHFTMERNLDARYKAWLPRDAAYWRPRTVKDNDTLIITSTVKPDLDRVEAREVKKGHVMTGLEAACRRSLERGGDVLWLRPGTTLTEPVWQKIHAGLAAHEDAAACIPIAPDGPNAFPGRDRFTPVSPDFAAVIDSVLFKKWPTRDMSVGLLSSACILLRAAALAVLGVPDVEGCGGNEEAALVEWGVRAITRQMKIYQRVDAFAGTVGAPPTLTPELIGRAQMRGVADVMKANTNELSADEREDVELAALATQWTGVRPGMAGLPYDYATWSAMQSTRIPRMTDAERIFAEDHLIVMPFPNNPRDTDWIWAADDWIIFIDDTVTLRPEAKTMFARTIMALPENSDVNIMFADHEVDFGGQLVPWFKGCFDYYRALQQDYFTHCAAIRAGTMPEKIEHRGQLFEYVLNVGKTAPRAIAHIPYVLATTRETAGANRDTLTYMLHAAVERHLKYEAIAGTAEISTRQELPNCLNTKFRAPKPHPKVAIIIPTAGDTWMLMPCLQTLTGMTQYDDYAVLVVPNKLKQSFDEFKAETERVDSRISVLGPAWSGPFNWATINNAAVAKVPGAEFFCFLNDDTRICNAMWLDYMVGMAARGDVCAVGAKLSFPAGFIQHVGVVSHRGIAGHVHLGQPLTQTGYWNAAAVTHENIAVTGACMVVEARKFKEVGGFDESYASNFNDVDFCWRAYEAAYRNVVEISAELQHVGGATRMNKPSDDDIKVMRAEWVRFAAERSLPDPYWSPNNGLMYAQDGSGTIIGLNYDALTWDDDPKMWRDAPRVLVINDTKGVTGPLLTETQRGNVVVTADMHDMVLTLTAPMPLNGNRWNIRSIKRIKAFLDAFGVERIVLCSLTGKSGRSSLDGLRMLRRLGLPISYQPTDAEMVCPRITMLRGDEPCNEAWREGAETCQACVDEHDSPFGYVDVYAWRQAWAEIVEIKEAAHVDGN